MEGNPIKTEENKLTKLPETTLGKSKLELIDKEIEDLKEEIRILALEIEEMEEQEERKREIEKEEQEKTEQKMISREKFLKTALMLMLGGIFTKSLFFKGKEETKPKNKAEIEKKSINNSVKEVKTENQKKYEHKVENEIEKCKEIIRNEQYEKIIENPYLVSSLYYSKEAILKMDSTVQNNPEKIICNVHPFITKQFRENYIKYLKNTIQTVNREKNRLDSLMQSNPLDAGSIGKDLQKNHLDAIDLFAKEGSPVYSISDGFIVLSENNWKKDDDMSTSSNRGGNTIIIFNSNEESFYRYAHLKETKIQAGKVVSSGEEIGVVGHTGINASKPGHGEHLHFEINRYNKDTGEMTSTDSLSLKKKLAI